MAFTFKIVKDVQLVRYIEEDNIRAIRLGNQLFLQAGIKNLQLRGDKTGTVDEKFTGYAIGELNYHETSDELQDDDLAISALNARDHNYLRPLKECCAKVVLSTKFKRCYESQGEYLFLVMPTISQIVNTNERKVQSGSSKINERQTIIHGSVICEDPITGEFNLNFFTTQIQEGEKDDEEISFP